MTDEEAVEKALPCLVPCRVAVGCPALWVNGKAVHSPTCPAFEREAVLALIRERVAEARADERGRGPCGVHPLACYSQTPGGEYLIGGCKACKSAAEARRPLVESLTECADAMMALVTMLRNDMSGDEANGMQRFNSRAFTNKIVRARALLAAEKAKGD